MRRFILPFGLATLCLSMAALAQPLPTSANAVQASPSREPAQALALDTALSLVANRNPLLAAARKEVDAVDGGILQARLFPNPELSLEMEDTRRDTRSTAGQLSLPIELGGKRAARISAAELAQQKAAAQLASVRADLRAQTVGAFFNVLVAQERLQLAEAAAAIAAKATTVAARRVAAGKVSPLEESRATVEQANANLEMAEAAALLDSARIQLAALWGNPQPAFTEAAGDLDALPSRAPVDVLVQALETAPDLVAARAEIDQRNALTGVERSKQYPDIRLTAGVTRNNELGRNQMMVGVSIPLPFFDRNQGNLYEALVRADQAQDLYAATRIELTQTLQQSSRQLTASRTSAQVLKIQVLPAAQRAYEAATIGFEAGKFGFLDVLDSQRTLFQARIRYLTVLASTYQAAIAIDRVLGR